MVGWILNHRWWQKRFTDAQEASRKEIAQAVARQTDKGRDAARVAVEMANLLEEI